MRRFIFKISFFVFIVFILSCFLDLFITFNLKKYQGVDIAQGEIKVWNDIYNGNIKSKLWVYGSSKAWVQFDSQIIEDSTNLTTYNFGTDGQGFKMQFFRHKELIKRNYLPKVIIYVVDVVGLRNQYELYNLEQFYPFVYESSVRSHIKKYKGFTNYDLYLPLVRYIGQRKIINVAIKQFLGVDKPKHIRNKGYLGQESKWDITALNEAKKESRFWYINNDIKLLNDFNNFIKQSDSLNIRLIFVYPPEHILGQKYIFKRTELIQTFKNIANKNKILFLDYSNDSLCNDTKYFYNTRHLNNYGSKIFSKKLVTNFLFRKEISRVVNH
jgi:hypothetical protein